MSQNSFPDNVPSAKQGTAASLAAPGRVGAGGTNPRCAGEAFQQGGFRGYVLFLRTEFHLLLILAIVLHLSAAVSWALSEPNLFGYVSAFGFGFLVSVLFLSWAAQ